MYGTEYIFHLFTYSSEIRGFGDGTVDKGIFLFFSASSAKSDFSGVDGTGGSGGPFTPQQTKTQNIIINRIARIIINLKPNHKA